MRALDEPARRLADDRAEGLEDGADLVLEITAHPDQQGPRRKLGAHGVAGLGFDVDLPEPAGANQLGDAGGVVAVGLRQHDLEAGVGVVAWRASMQSSGRPSARSSFHSQTESGPVSMPMRSASGARCRTKAAMAPGSVAVTPSTSVLPCSSTTQIAVVFWDTSRPT